MPSRRSMTTSRQLFADDLSAAHAERKRCLRRVYKYTADSIEAKQNLRDARHNFWAQLPGYILLSMSSGTTSIYSGLNSWDTTTSLSRPIGQQYSDTLADDFRQAERDVDVAKQDLKRVKHELREARYDLAVADWQIDKLDRLIRL